MAQIDALLQSLTKFGAQGALLSSGEKVQLVFPTGKRYASQTTPHDSLVKLVDGDRPADDAVEPQRRHDVRLPARRRRRSRVRVDAGIIGLEGRDRGPIRPTRRRRPRRTFRGRRPGSAAAPPPRAAPPRLLRRPPPEPVPAPTPQSSYANVQVDSAIEKLLLRMLELGASDLHLSSGAAPSVRLHGVDPASAGRSRLLRRTSCSRASTRSLPTRNREEFERRNDTDFAHAIPGVSRFRVEPLPRPQRARRRLPRDPLRDPARRRSSACRRACSSSAT